MKILILAGVSAGVSAVSETLCEHHFTGQTTQVIACPGGRLKVNSATYGRENGDNETCCKNKRLCKGSTTSTCTVSALDAIGEKCNGESECTVYGSMNGLLGDPCFRNHKYLTYDYECDYSSPISVASFCEMDMENRTTSFECPEGTSVSIVSAIWGRAKDQFCCPNKHEKDCMADACSDSFDATQVISERCNGGSRCEWNKEEMQLVDPCPKTYKYMAVEYRCDRPVAMADSHTFTPLPFSPPVKSGNQCGDLIALSKTKLVASIDAIAGQDQSIHRGWFGSLSKQSQPEQKRNSLFPKNYQKLEKWMTEECACGPDDGSMNQMEANPWNAFQSVHSAMSAVADRIEDVCPEASAHLKKKLRHAWNFLTHSKKRRQHLIELFNADSNVARVE